MGGKDKKKKENIAIPLEDDPESLLELLELLDLVPLSPGLST